VRTAGTDEDAIAAELAIQAASALQVLDLDTVYEARFDIVPPGDEPVGAENYVTSCDLGIFVDQATEPVAPQQMDTRTFCG
jgi:hypothetical protein